MRSSPEMRVSLVLRSILAVRGKSVLQRIDVVNHGHGSFFAEQLDEFFMARSSRRGNTDERNARGARGPRVIHGVAQIPDFAMADFGANLVQAFGMGLRIRHVIHADHRIEDLLAKSIERDLRFPAESAGKDGERVIRSEAVEQAFAREPALTKNQAVMVIAQENLLEACDHIFEIDLFTVLLDHAVRKLPVVVEAAAVLPGLDFVVRRYHTGEMAHRSLNGGAIGFADIHQNAIHIENNQVFHQTFSSSASTSRACARVPTVMRTPPGIS